MPCGGSGFIGGDHGRWHACDASVFDGLWHITQYSVLLRSVAVQRESARGTGCSWPAPPPSRRGATVEPSTEKYITLFVRSVLNALLRQWCRAGPFPCGAPRRRSRRCRWPPPERRA